MAYGAKPKGKAKPSRYPFGPATGTEMLNKGKSKRVKKGGK
jgi:hypothetical protein